MSGTGGLPPTDPQELLRRVGTQERRISEAAETIADSAARQDISDRAQLAATVSMVFLVCLPVSLLVLLILAFRAESATAAVSGVVEILKSVLLPVVTLVLGYYFARGRG